MDITDMLSEDDKKPIGESENPFLWTKTKLDYYSKPIDDPVNDVKLSPSSISMLLFNAGSWHTQYTGERVKVFDGNTKTVLGQCVHYCAEMYMKNGEVKSEDHDEIYTYVKNFKWNPKVDMDAVLNEYLNMFHALKVAYLDIELEDKKLNEHHIEKYIEIDECIKFSTKGEFNIAGSVDKYTNSKITDYKTCQTKPSKMDDAHYFQCLVYTWIINKNKMADIKEVEIVYVQRKTKTISPRVWVFKRKIKEKDFDYIENLIFNIYRSIDLSKTNPEYTDLLFRFNPLTFYGN